jgi:peptidoglycan/LPS O-acetylase OafA/YrhL
MTLGALTYPLYLLHNRIGKLVYVAIDGHIPTAWSLLLITVTGFLIAFVVTATVERRLVPYLARTELYRRMAGLSPT